MTPTTTEDAASTSSSSQKETHVQKDKVQIEAEAEDEESLQRRSFQVEFDPDGTSEIARGMSDRQARARRHRLEERLAASSPSSSLLVTEENQEKLERLKYLQKDDENPNLTALNDKQKRAFQKRNKLKDKAVTAKLERLETKRLQAQVDATEASEILETDAVGLLEAEHDMERTTALTQLQLKRQLQADNNPSHRHIYNLQLLDYGPYGLEYSRSGRHGILYGVKGHVALLDCLNLSLETEFYVQDRIRDACFLHNYSSMLLATAQSNHVFIYDKRGTEIHRLNEHNDPMALEYLPYHWLLASIGRAGWLKYQDVSTGQLVSQHATKLGCCHVLRQNPATAVLHAGHSNGTVTLWSPASSQYLAKLHCHKGAAVHSLAMDLSGHTMVTGGADRQVHIWDLRMLQKTHSYYTVAGIPTSLDISQRGILGVGHAGHATFWSPQALKQKVKDPYMHHAMPGCSPVETLRFRPFEDVCGIGHARGISSIVVPGAGEPNLDTSEYDTNPMQDTKQRQEMEVQALLDKLSPDMIGLDSTAAGGGAADLSYQVGGIEESDPHRRLERLYDLQEAANAKPNKSSPVKKQKTKKRGRSKIQTKLRRKRHNIIDQATIKLREAREKEKASVAAAATAKDSGLSSAPAESLRESAPTALKRFF